MALSREVDLDFIINKLGAKKSGKEYRALCPFHPDRNPSLFINPEKGVFHCFGCGAKGTLKDLEVLLKKGVIEKSEPKEDTKVKSFLKKPKKEKSNAKIYTPEEVRKVVEGIKEKEGWERVIYFEYIDLNDILRYTKVRFEKGKEKTFRIFFHTEDRRLFFYNLNTLKDWEGKLGWYRKLYFAEGEKCVHKLIDHIPDWEDDVAVLGFQNVETEIAYLKEEIEEGKVNPWQTFGGKEIVIFADNDKVGKKKAYELVNFLKDFAPESITLVEFHDKDIGYDIADFLEEGGDIDTAISEYGIKIEGRIGFYGSPLKALNIQIDPPKSILGKLNIPQGTVGLIAGTGGVGKSTISFLLTVLLNIQGLKVAYLMLEDDAMKTGLYRYQKIVSKLLYKNFCVEDGECFSTRCKGHIEFLEEIDLQVDKEWCKKDLIYIANMEIKYSPDYLPSWVEFLFKQGFDVVFVDPVGYLMKSENDNEYAQMMLSKLNQLTAQYMKNVFLIHHTGKEGWRASSFTSREEFANAVRGASAWVNNARYGLFIKRHIEGGWLCINFKNNLMPFQDFKVVEVYSSLPTNIELVDFETEIEKEKELKKKAKKDKASPNKQENKEIDTSIYEENDNEGSFPFDEEDDIDFLSL